MNEKPDFSTMNGSQLLEAYNSYTLSKRRAKFQNLADGVKRCEAAYAASVEGPGEEENAVAKKADKTPKAKKAKKSSTNGGTRGRKRTGNTINILTEGKKNPRREGTDAANHFEAMKKFPKVADYLDQFKDKKKAGQWLWNTVRDGHVEVVQK